MDEQEIASLVKTVTDYLDGALFKSSLGRLFNVMQAVNNAKNIKLYSISGKRLGKLNFFHMVTSPATGDIIHLDGYMKIHPTLPFPVEIRQTVAGITVASYYVMLKDKSISFGKKVKIKNKMLYFLQGIAFTMSNVEKLTCGFFGSKK